METSRDKSFCSEVVADAVPMVVADVRIDPRFEDNPLVTGELRIRGDLGVPLIGRDGLPLGACAPSTGDSVDSAPRRSRR